MIWKQAGAFRDFIPDGLKIDCYRQRVMAKFSNKEQDADRAFTGEGYPYHRNAWMFLNTNRAVIDYRIWFQSAPKTLDLHHMKGWSPLLTLDKQSKSTQPRELSFVIRWKSQREKKNQSKVNRKSIKEMKPLGGGTGWRVGNKEKLLDSDKQNINLAVKVICDCTDIYMFLFIWEHC